MKVEICEHCGKPGDYPTCDAPRKSRKPRIERELADAQSRISTLEAALRDTADALSDALDELGIQDNTRTNFDTMRGQLDSARKALGDL